MRRARLVEASVHREGGGWRRRHKGRDRGEKGGWKRRMPVVPSPRYESANSLLPPGFSRYPLSLFLSLYFSFSLSLLYPVYRITAVSQCSSRVTTAQCLPRVVVRSTALSLHLVTLFQQQSLSLVQNCVVHQIGSIVFFL